LVRDDNLERTWTDIQTCLRGSFPETVYQTWFARLRPVKVDGPVIYVTAPSRVREWVARRFGAALNAATAATVPGLKRLELVDEATAAAPAASPGAAAVFEPSRLTSKFETFVIGPENRFAHAAALAVAEMPAQAYNPLFLHGPPGVGKTHLLQAIGAYTAVHSPSMSIHYSTVENFTGNFIQAIRHDDVEAFKKVYRRADVLLLDDVQFLDGKTKTAEEFFHTIDTAIASGRQVALTADKPPSAMPMLETRLRERLQAGLLVDLGEPGFQTRLAILQCLSARDPALRETGSAEVLEQIARRVTTNVRALRAALTRLTAYASLTGTSITLPVVDDVLDHLYGSPAAASNRSETLTVDQIQAAVSKALQLEPADLLSPRRNRRLVYARQVAMYLSRELTDLSLPSIAALFGGRDHTTVLHAHRKIKNLILTEESTRALIASLVADLTGTPQHDAQHSSRFGP
jgi:chromosomal replication initiator protein